MHDALIGAANVVLEHLSALVPLDGHHLVLLADGEQDFQPDPTGFPADVKTKLNQLLGWGSVMVSAACVAGLFMVAGKMAVSHQRGEGHEHAAGLGKVALACLLVGTAATLVSALV